jgi:hypothetical protein
MIKTKKFGKIAFGVALISFFYSLSGCSNSNESKRKENYNKLLAEQQAKIESVDAQKYDISSKNSTQGQSYSTEQENKEETDPCINQIIEEENTGTRKEQKETQNLESNVYKEAERIEETKEKSSGLEKITDRHFFGQGTVLKVEVVEAGSKYPVDSFVKLLDKNEGSIRYREAGEIKLPYEENTKDGVVSFNIPNCDVTLIDSIEVTVMGFKGFKSKLPLKDLFRYNSSSTDKLPDEIKNKLSFVYLQNQSGGIRVDYKNKNEFFEKVENKRYSEEDHVGAHQGMFWLVPIRVELEELADKIKIEENGP